MSERDLVLRLIKDDLINTQLVSGLEKLDLEPGSYTLHLGETILLCVGFTDNVLDTVLEKYVTMKSKVMKFDLTNGPKKLDQLANEIYQQLSQMKTTTK